MPNRLAAETSPYLRQHADNPVDWYPWGEEAFAAAAERDCPILLSIGYSACHWCHVMAHESFEHEPTAAQMNELFVNIKVDREERPDVDAIYMDAVQAMTGSGGWPMTVFLTPDRRPFFGGTYFPRVARGGMISFTDLLGRIDELWRTRRDELVAQADELTEAIASAGQVDPGDGVPGHDAVDAAVTELVRQHDAEWGGFGNAPKFPQTLSLDLLLRHHVATGDTAALDVVTTSLDAMASGGIYDHLGGGFARYSVDREWLVPHFEKMLYDEALLARIYLHAWKVTRKATYLQVLAETVAYVLRDLRHDDGGFYSAEDADSEGVEGKFYVWSIDEVREVLGEHADAAIAWWGVTEEGNFEGANILVRPERGDLLRPPPIETARELLLRRRDSRVRPGLDDKVLTEWNALMLATLAEAAAATGMDHWRNAAVINAEFLIAKLRRPDGRWLRSWHPDASASDATGSTAENLAFAADYAALIDAFVRLAETTGEARWIAEARATADGLIELFWDDERGGVFTTGSDAPALVTRPKDTMDNAIPGANSLAANGLLRLSALTGDAGYEERAVAILKLVGESTKRHPTAFGHLLAAIDFHASGPAEIAVVGDRPDLVDALAEQYLPNAVVAWGEPYPSPLWDDRDDGPDHGGQAYVCRNFACQAPVSTVEALIAQLANP